MSKLAEKLLKGDHLDEKELEFSRNKMLKYSKQIQKLIKQI